MNKILKLSFFLICVIVFNTIHLKAQPIDTSLVTRNLKVRLLPEVQLGILSENALKDYLERQLITTTLSSRGFDNMIFFKISDQILAVDTNYEDRIVTTYSTPACLKGGKECYFVYGFDKRNNRFYRLRGTKGNDFDELYSNMDQWEYWDQIPKIRSSTVRKFIREFWVDGLNLECLINSLQGKEGDCLDSYSPKLETN